MNRACPHCGSEVPGGAFCRVCGAALPPTPGDQRPAGTPWKVIAVIGAVLAVLVATVVVVLRLTGAGVDGTAIAAPDSRGATATTSPVTPSEQGSVGGRATPDSRVPATASTAISSPPAGTADTNDFRGYAMSAAEPLTQDASGYALFFSSPTNNIHCRMNAGTADQDGDATCYIGEKQWTGAAAPAGCAGNWADNYVAVSVTGVQSGLCLSDVRVPPVSATLPYGKSLSTGVVTCASAESGVTCIHLASGQGFTLSRSVITTF